MSRNSRKRHAGHVARLRERRAALAWRTTTRPRLLVHADGSRVTSAQAPCTCARARVTRLGIETNGELCKSLLANRHTTAATAP